MADQQTYHSEHGLHRGSRRPIIGVGPVRKAFAGLLLLALTACGGNTLCDCQTEAGKENPDREFMGECEQLYKGMTYEEMEEELKEMRPIGSRSTLLLLVLVLFAGIFPYSSSAQSPNFTQYKVDDGLPSSVVYGSFEDREGFIWFATEFGVSRYDGYEFTNYTTDDGLSDNVIFDFFEDSQGRIWFITYNGIPCYYQNGKIVSYSDRPELSKSSKREMISTILEGRDGTIWIGRKLSSVLGITRSDSLFHQPIKHILEVIKSQVTPVAPIWSADSSIYLITGSSVIHLDESTNKWDYYVDSLPVQFFAPIFSAPIPRGLVIAKKEKLYRVMVRRQGDCDRQPDRDPQWITVYLHRPDPTG